mgnify:CR=1 FL=1
MRADVRLEFVPEALLAAGKPRVRTETLHAPTPNDGPSKREQEHAFTWWERVTVDRLALPPPLRKHEALPSAGSRELMLSPLGRMAHVAAEEYRARDGEHERERRERREALQDRLSSPLARDCLEYICSTEKLGGAPPGADGSSPGAGDGPRVRLGDPVVNDAAAG